MSGCSFENGGYVTYQALTYDLLNIMLGNGFKVIYPDPIQGGITAQTTKFTLEADIPADPLAATQPWRIQFDASDVNSPSDPGCLRVYVGTPIQLPKDGSVSLEYPGSLAASNADKTAGEFPRKSGELTCGYYTFTGSTQTEDTQQYRLSIPFGSKHFSVPSINTY